MLNANNCRHFNVHEQDKFQTQSAEHEKSFINLGAVFGHFRLKPAFSARYDNYFLGEFSIVGGQEKYFENRSTDQN